MFIMPPSASAAKNWVLTLNNWTQEEFDALALFCTTSDVVYCVVGKETGESGTPHLQIYLSLTSRKRFNQVKTLCGSQRYHTEIARGSPEENRTYCTKDGDYTEYGSLPAGQGKRCDLDRFYEWFDAHCETNGTKPSYQQCAQEHPVVLARYPGVMRIAYARTPAPILRPDAVCRPWQSQVLREVTDPANDRHVVFYVDYDGNSGKTWLQQHLLDKHPKRVQILGVGKRDDIAYMIDETKDIFLINVPRGAMEYLQYSVLEMIKDRLVVSPKYQSMVKVLDKVPHVYVFTNSDPDYDKLSADRLVIRSDFN